MASPSSLPGGWTRYFSQRGQAYYYVNEDRGLTQWERPDDPEPAAKRPRVDDSGLHEKHALEVAGLRAKIMELSSKGSVAAGHNAQHGRVVFSPFHRDQASLER